MSSPARYRDVSALLAGALPAWGDLHMPVDDLLEMCDAEDLTPIIHHRVTAGGACGDWPDNVCDALAIKARAAAGEELLRGAETRAVVEALAAAGVPALLIKGTPLAYSVYPLPSARPRDDTDLMILPAQVDAARDVMASIGYTPTVHCSDLFSQFEVQKRDRFGVVHAFDVHWKISTQPVFAGVLTCEEMFPRAVPVPALGPAAMAPSSIDALLLACIHPVMHHRNVERVLWTYDVHLLASRLAPNDFSNFVGFAKHKRVAAVCGHRLRRAQKMFGTAVPPEPLSELSAAVDEPSAAYLASHRRWHHELASSLGGLPRFGHRVRLLRDVLLPSPGYMLGSYGLRGKPLAPWLLPALYVHRNVRGAWKILAGKK
jgi:hypothetical protein